MTETALPLAGRRITLAVTGSIAAYKAPTLLRLLKKAGASVEVALSRSALQFVGAATFQGLNARPPLSELFDPSHGGELHVDLAKRSDAVVIAPASADVIARLAAGRADDLIAALALSAACPVLLAPAMHPNMWRHPATQRNLETLRRDGRVRLVGPVEGEVASGDVGLGRMAEPEAIADAVFKACVNAELSGRHLVITAGPTQEPIDPVRVLSNRSSGKMGFALAERARARGAQVTLIAGPVALQAPPGVERIDVETALELRDALWNALGQDLRAADALIMAAAVADYRPRDAGSAKLKRQGSLALELVPNPDLLAEVGAARSARCPVLVGFALETGNDEQTVDSARAKLERKQLDLVVANRASEALGGDGTRITLVTETGAEALGPLSKPEAADRILDFVASRLATVPA
jgi:phosphopantothenoylcysteine decarboxylase/phosphopantothenate--cysteine ligase